MSPRQDRRIRLKIGSVLLYGFGGLMVAAVIVVLTISIYTGQRNTVELARERAELTIALVEDGISHRLDPVAHAATELAQLISAERVDPLRDGRFLDLAGGVLSALPQISALRYMSAEGVVFRVARSDIGGFRHRVYNDETPNVARINEAVREAGKPFWGDIFWGEALSEPAVNLRAPVRFDGKFVGHISALVSIANLSRMLLEVTENHRAHAFILIDGDRVLAHPGLIFGRDGGTPDEVLPRIDEVGDPMLARIWEPGEFIDRQRSQRILGARGHIARVGGGTYIYIYDEMTNYGPRPWIVGTYLQEDTLEAAINRIWVAAGAGLVVLAIASIMAWQVGRRVAEPVVALAASARQLRNLDFAGMVPLKRSVLRETDEAAQAFNAMIEGLRWFEAYVPKTLVRRLIGRGGQMQLASIERELTVMFTDIRGFTALSEQMTASEVAAFLNRHFQLLEACVEAQEGTVDKYLGDGMMAFWGAPDEQPDHAERACRAASAIATALQADNAARRDKGEGNVRVRIGLHTGRATIGNVGSASRLNYTIVGDTVNSAERLCELGREVMTEQTQIAILASARTVELAGDGFDFRRVGDMVLRGRKGETEVFQLAVEEEASVAEPQSALPRG